ncbi:hypothetical protein ACGTJS_09155 [Faucicola mancuniensis]|uniref:hypothetical protein n=1 Tax=Faucicola mancuniensis TaxID=1309795 RepID=UPI0028E862D5|nr:hypothetical protein [uncultured Moraxella sp.]
MKIINNETTQHSKIGSQPFDNVNQNNHYIGQNKTDIVKKLLNLKVDYVEFVHWLAVPTLGLLLKFDKQICYQISDY